MYKELRSIRHQLENKVYVFSLHQSQKAYFDKNKKNQRAYWSMIMHAASFRWSYILIVLLIMILFARGYFIQENLPQYQQHDTISGPSHKMKFNLHTFSYVVPSQIAIVHTCLNWDPKFYWLVHMVKVANLRLICRGGLYSGC